MWKETDFNDLLIIRWNHWYSSISISKAVVKLIRTASISSREHSYPLHITHTRVSLDTGRTLNVHKTFRRRPGRLMYVHFTSCAQGGLSPNSTSIIKWIKPNYLTSISPKIIGKPKVFQWFQGGQKLINSLKFAQR